MRLGLVSSVGVKSIWDNGCTDNGIGYRIFVDLGQFEDSVGTIVR
jgi:hypothetical protein